jgi:hypothetical protein
MRGRGRYLLPIRHPRESGDLSMCTGYAIPADAGMDCFDWIPRSSRGMTGVTGRLSSWRRPGSSTARGGIPAGAGMGYLCWIPRSSRGMTLGRGGMTRHLSSRRRPGSRVGGTCPESLLDVGRAGSLRALLSNCPEIPAFAGMTTGSGENPVSAAVPRVGMTSAVEVVAG